MIVCHQISEDCQYIPVHFNLVFNGGCDFYRDYPDDSLILEMLARIKDQKTRFFVIDLSFVRSIGYINDKLDDSFRRDKVLIFYKASEIVRAKLEDDFKDIVIDDSDNLYVSSEEGNRYFKYFLNKDGNFDAKVRSIKVRQVGDILKDSAIYKEEYLESSNIYANTYFNVKALFADPLTFKIVVYDLCATIRSNFHSFDALLCVSNNGAALSSVVGRMLRKSVIYLMNLGPHITIKDAKVIEKIEIGQKFIFMYDFICLGTEFKMARMVARMRGAEVIGGVGVANHLPIPKLGNFSFMKINEDYDFKYKLSIYPDSKG